MKALREMYHGQRDGNSDECQKKCNPENKKFRELDEQEVKKIKDCLVENKCLKNPNARFNHRNSTEFQNFVRCKHEKCPNDGLRFSTTRLPSVTATPNVSVNGSVDGSVNGSVNRSVDGSVNGSVNASLTV